MGRTVPKGRATRKPVHEPTNARSLSSVIPALGIAEASLMLSLPSIGLLGKAQPPPKMPRTAAVYVPEETYTDPSADVVLVSSDGRRFRVHSYMLRAFR